MINEERLKHMTRMAIFEKEHGPDYQPMLHYNKREYKTLHSVGGFISGTIFFLIVYVLIIMFFLSEVLENLNTVYLMLFILIGILAYAVYIILHVYKIRRMAARRYTRGKKYIKELKEAYETLGKMYEYEAEQAKPAAAREAVKEDDWED